MVKRACRAGIAVVVAAAAAAGGEERASSPVSSFDARAFGARGDGTTNDTEAIQRAVDACNAAGGGTVWLGPGTYLSGTIVLKDRVTLHIGAGATLLGSTRSEDFPRMIPALRSYTDTYVNQSLLFAEGARAIGIAGRGTIDGQGAAYKGKPYLERPYLIRFVSCSEVAVEDVTLRNSPMWVQQYLACEYLTIRGITVTSHVNHNNDMLDVDCCRNVRIADCFGDSGDDAITLKSTADRPCANVVVTNCSVFSTCNAIKFGTESNGGFKNIAITNCALGPLRPEGGFFGKTMLAGIALEIVDGGTLDRVAISNIVMTGVRVPIFMRLGNRARPFAKDGAKPGMGAFRNVTISNVVAEATERIGCSITGLPGHPIRNVCLSDIRLVLPGGGTAAEAGRDIPERPEAYPECTMFGVLPAYGFFVRHVDGIAFDNVKVACAAGDERPALVFHDVKDAEVSGFGAAAAAAGVPIVAFKGVERALLRGCSVPAGATTFLRLEGACARIAALGNDLAGLPDPFAFGPGVDRSVLRAE